MTFTINAENRINFYEQLYQYSRTGYFLLGSVSYVKSGAVPEKLDAIIDDSIAEKLAEEQINELKKM